MRCTRVVAVAAAFWLGLAAVAGAAQAPRFRLRLATVASPQQPQVKGFMKFAEVVKELSSGNIVVEVFHSGQLGDQKTQVLGTMRGSIDMSDGSPTWFADLVPYPEISVLEAAYAYRSLDHLYQVVNGPVGKKYWDELRKRSGIVVLDTWYLGTRQLNLRRSVGVVRTPADMRNVKLRMPPSEPWMDIGRGLGAQPTPLGFTEVYLALKTGTIDGQDNPLPTVEANKFYEATHYIVLTDHQMTIINPSINEQVWNRMPDEYKVYMLKALEVARYYNNQLVLEQEASLLSKFVNEYGMEVIIPDKAAFMNSMKEVYKKNEKVWGAGVYEAIQAMGADLYSAR